jgi:hypothetical protein
MVTLLFLIMLVTLAVHPFLLELKLPLEKSAFLASALYMLSPVSKTLVVSLHGAVPHQ